LKKEEKFVWNVEHDEAFQTLKKIEGPEKATRGDE
jgi:hypothetical protein